MKKQRAYRFRIYPNKEQEKLIHKTFGCCRFVYNVVRQIKRCTFRQIIRCDFAAQLRCLGTLLDAETALCFHK